MPTDETMLEALVNLVEREERRAQYVEALVLDGEASSFYVKRAIESRLIAEALRFRLASLTAPAAQEEDAEIAALKAAMRALSAIADSNQRRPAMDVANSGIATARQALIEIAALATDAARAFEPRGRE